MVKDKVTITMETITKKSADTHKQILRPLAMVFGLTLGYRFDIMKLIAVNSELFFLLGCGGGGGSMDMYMMKFVIILGIYIVIDMY